MMMKLSDYVAEFVARLGVRHVFLLPGGACMHLADSFGKCKGFQYVVCLHEQACAYAAEAYAEYTGHLGVALVSAGPAGTNAVSGVGASWLESSSCLFISGNAKRADLIGDHGVRSMGHQELDIVSIVKPITKYAVTVLNPLSIRYHLERAFYLATHGRRGPVWLDIPLDVQAARIDTQRLAGFDGHPSESSGGSNLAEAVSRTIDLLKQSTRPVFLIGNGVKSAHAERLLLELLEKVRVPLLLTWKAIDVVPEDYPLYRGRPGGTGQRGANFTQQNADCIIVIGARLDLPSLAFDHANFAKYATRVMVDVDPTEIWKMKTEIHVPVCADAGDFLGEFLKQADKLGDYEPRPWLEKTREWQEKYPVVLAEYRDKNADYASSYRFYDVLSDELTDADVLVTGGAGACSDILMQAFRLKSGQRVINAPGIGAMGTGIPAAIGVCLAAGGRRTVCIDGDGGFQLNIQELETLRRLNLPIKYFVLNNRGYGSITAMQKHHFQGRYVGANPESGLTLPDVIKVAGAYNLQTARIRHNAEIEERLPGILRMKEAVICEVVVLPDEPTIPRAVATVLADGTVVSRPMEDMLPLLDRAEFEANMIGRPPGGDSPSAPHDSFAPPE